MTDNIHQHLLDMLVEEGLVKMSERDREFA